MPSRNGREGNRECDLLGTLDADRIGRTNVDRVVVTERYGMRKT